MCFSYQNTFNSNLSLSSVQFSATRTTTRTTKRKAAARDVGSGADGARAAAVRSASAASRVVTTGLTETIPKGYAGIDDETGEPFKILSAGKNKAKIIRHPSVSKPINNNISIIDALSFSVRSPVFSEQKNSYVDTSSLDWIVSNLRRFMTIEAIDHRKGLYGYKHSVRLDDGAGVIAWGGASQKGSVFVSLMGKGCSMVEDWEGLASWLEEHGARITRVDIAHDDFEGSNVSIDWAVEQYLNEGGFNAGGRTPSHDVRGEWLRLGEKSSKGITLYIGSRESGKMLRIYEKGKQLGDAESPWVRVELELHGKDRVIPYDIILNSSAYLAGAYPCLAKLNKKQSRIKTISKAAAITFERALEIAKNQVGKFIHLAMQVFHGDYAEVIYRLINKTGYPKRIDPYSYQIGKNPAICLGGVA